MPGAAPYLAAAAWMGAKPLREIRLVELPEGRVIVPAVVKQERIQFHAALDHQFLAERLMTFNAPASLYLLK